MKDRVAASSIVLSSELPILIIVMIKMNEILES